MSAAIAVTALAAEAAIGYPKRLSSLIGHPVGWMAALIGACERRWNPVRFSPFRRRIAGAATMLIVAGAAGAVAYAVSQGVDSVLEGPARLIALALLATPGLAQRSLYEHVRPVAAALAGGDLASARGLVARIVGRDTEQLDENGISRAAIESLAESFNDAVVAPAFWLLVGGLPGLYVYKAVNTADSMIGHRDERYAMFGWAAARSDDLMGLLPARISGLLICIAGAGGFFTMIRDAPRHASPNAGWPEAAMAGALGVKLGGLVSYDGCPAPRPWFGSGQGSLDASAIRAALRLYLKACAALWALIGAAAWAL